MICTYILLLAASGLVASESNMEKYKVVPDIISEVPKNSVTVKYGDLIVDQGNELTPTQVHDKPTSISWPVEDGAYYTLIMNDPDIPAFVGAKDVQHWLVVNVPDDHISEGETLFDYSGAGPPQGSGFHRYIFLVYKQANKIPKSQYENIKDIKLESRRSHPLPTLLKQLNLEGTVPVAGNFFRAQYDDNVPKYYQEKIRKYERKSGNSKMC